MPFTNEHSARIKNPRRFQHDTFRRMTLPDSNVSIIIGKLRGDTNTTVQSYRFPVSHYTPEAARKWLRDNNVRYILFEPAIQTMQSIDK